MHHPRHAVPSGRVRKRVAVCGLPAVVATALIPTGAAYALELEIDPAAASHSDQLYPLDTPDYAQNPGASTDLRNSDDNVLDSADHSDSGGPSEEEPRRKVIRDCTKEGLADIAWDIWWSVSHEHSFSLPQQAEEAIEGCLKTYIGEPESAVAQSIAAAITNGAHSFLAVDPDLYGLADWLQIVDYYYIPY